MPPQDLCFPLRPPRKTTPPPPCQERQSTLRPDPLRARKIERFLSQPFFVAETFTGFPGNYTKKEDTLRSFREICDGKWDHLPEAAFMYVGAIEEAAAKAEKLKLS